MYITSEVALYKGSMSIVKSPPSIRARDIFSLISSTFLIPIVVTMASQVFEDLPKMKNDDFIAMEDHFEIDSALVMSLLEESQNDERDEERLNSLIRSLEDEIKASTTMEEHKFFGFEALAAISSGEDSRSCNLVEQMDDPECFDSCNNFEFRWIDQLDLVPSSPSDHFSSYCMEHCGIHGMDGKIEGGAQNYYSEVCNNGVHMEELQEFHSSLWQDQTYNFELMCE